MKVFIYLIIIVIIQNGNYKQKYDKPNMLDSIFCAQENTFKDGNFKVLNSYRNQSEWWKKLKYSSENDTLFIIECWGVQGNFAFTIWSNSDTISYTNETGNFIFTNEPQFTKYMIQLVSDWNISQINLEEKINANLIPEEWILATRIIIKNKNYKIDCIRFKGFFDITRDIY